jgi:ribose 5-phosphate isomerase A
MTKDQQKRAAAEAAAALVDPGMTVGLGTGTTADIFIQVLASARLDIRCVPTSEASGRLARSLGLATLELDEADTIDLTIDGADVIGGELALIKGGGAALLREKLVWSASRRCVVIADASKQVTKLGRFPLPVEVTPFGHLGTARRVADALESAGLGVQAVLRVRDGDPVRTDSGNLIYDVPCGVIENPAALAAALKSVTGVVDHGLFLGLAERALVATDQGVITLWP